MAKLHGVKTLDMVNGEITKVAYDGAEYECVGGYAQESDLVLIKDGWDFATKGAFYASVGVDSEGDAEIIDDDGDTNVNYRHTYDLFRKVSASQPSLEDRVSTNEKDIESLKSDVAALKGEPEAGYVWIDKSEAKEGDFVKFDEAPNEYLTAGEYYEIYRVDGCGDPQIRDDFGDGFDTCDADDFEVYRKVSAAEPKPERLKVGDYAKVVKNDSHHCAEIDEIVLVKRDDKDFAPFHCEKLNGNEAGIFYEYELVRATDEEVDEAIDAVARAKFKKGDKVRLKSGGGEYPLLGFENGKVCTVIHNDYYHGDAEKKIQIECGCYYGYATPDQLELLPEEEVAENEKWAAIGREVGEYRVGDIVAYDDQRWFENSGIGEVIGSGDVGNPEVEAIDYEGCRASYFLKPECLNLVTPVEARFDRKDDE